MHCATLTPVSVLLVLVLVVKPSRGAWDSAASFVWRQVMRQTEELWSWGSNKRCEEYTDGKTKRGEKKKAMTSVRVAKQGKESYRKQWDVKQRVRWRSATHIGVRATSLVLAFSYVDKQIDTETWEPKQVIARCYWGLLMRISRLGFQLLMTCKSHGLLSLEQVFQNLLFVVCKESWKNREGSAMRL